MPNFPLLVLQYQILSHTKQAPVEYLPIHPQTKQAANQFLSHHYQILHSLNKIFQYFPIIP